MVSIRRYGTHYEPEEITCPRCRSVLGVRVHEWKSGTYGGEKVIECPVCRHTIVRPGTEYTGDF